MRSARLSSDTRRAVAVMRLSGASTRPATPQPITAASSSTPMKASPYCRATSRSASPASASGRVRSKLRPISQRLASSNTPVDAPTSSA